MRLRLPRKIVFFLLSHSLPLTFEFCLRPAAILEVISQECFVPLVGPLVSEGKGFNFRFHPVEQVLCKPGEF